MGLETADAVPVIAGVIAVVVCAGSVLPGGVGANGRIGDEIAVNMSYLVQVRPRIRC